MITLLTSQCGMQFNTMKNDEITYFSLSLTLCKEIWHRGKFEYFDGGKKIQLVAKIEYYI